MLEIGKIYYVLTYGLNEFLFSKVEGRYKTACSKWMDVKRNHVYDGYKGDVLVVFDEHIRKLRLANRNEIAIWNRTFNDNIEIEDYE